MITALSESRNTFSFNRLIGFGPYEPAEISGKLFSTSSSCDTANALESFGFLNGYQYIRSNNGERFVTASFEINKEQQQEVMIVSIGKSPQLKEYFYISNGIITKGPQYYFDGVFINSPNPDEFLCPLRVPDFKTSLHHELDQNEIDEVGILMAIKYGDYDALRKISLSDDVPRDVLSDMTKK